MGGSGAIDPQALSLLRKCLRYEPEERGTCADLLSHPYFEGFEAKFDEDFKRALLKDKEEAESTLVRKSKKNRKV